MDAIFPPENRFMPQTKISAGIDQAVVFAKELDIVRQRRRVAGLGDSQFEHGWFEKGPSKADTGDGPSPSLATDRPPLADADPVGLALSGGGVRSAAFALGILQAFHRFGLMRYVDYLSAVSGGTYAAGMFIQSLKKNEPYTQHNCDLSPDRSGKSSEFVERVSSRGNYLFRSDLFLARFIPGFVLNLAPQLCLLTAVGSGVAYLWRCLDFEPVRYHLSAFGMSDLSAAYLPSILAGILWILCYVIGLLAASQPLKRVSSWLLAATLGSLLIGTAVVIGNGDVTFNLTKPSLSGEETKIEWLSNLWAPLLSLVGLGLIPLLMPKKLLRSGTQPRGWFDSWIFYYVSLALFIGVPLVFVGYFAKENISGFNDFRGPAFLPADIKDPRILGALVDPDGPARIIFEFSDLGTDRELATSPSSARQESPNPTSPRGPLYAQLRLPDPNSARLLSWQLKQLSESSNREHDASLALGIPDQFPLPLKSDREQPAQPSWHQWRYFESYLSVPRELLGYLIGSGGVSYRNYLRCQAETRELHERVARELTNCSRKHLLFHFSHSVEGTQPNRQTPPKVVKLKNPPSAIHDQLIAIWGLDLKQEIPPGIIPIQSYASLNRNLLEVTLPHAIRDRNELRRMNLIEYDQYHRLTWFIGSLIAAIVLGRWINPNHTGLHGYYRDRLTGTYLNRGTNQTNTCYPQFKISALSEVNVHEQGAPYPLFQTSVLAREAWEHAEQLQRPFRPFILAPAYCGNRHLKYVSTSALQEHEPSLADTIAISGGAIAPAFFVHHILAFLINTMNWRMGQLFPNPLASRWQRPNMLQRLIDNLRQSLYGLEHTPANILLTDGGHSENLGIEPLLTRRCRLIIVSDAGYDPKHTLDDLAKVVRRLESSEGIRLADVLPCFADASPADGQPLRVPGNMAAPLGTRNCDAAIREHQEVVDQLFKRLSQHLEKRHFFVAKILYPECGSADSNGNCQHGEFEGRLIYIKPCLTGDEGLQLCNYASQHIEFPHESTLDQAFDEAQFEAYWRLGFHSGIDLCRNLPDPQGIDPKDQQPNLWSPSKPWNLNQICDRLMGKDTFSAKPIHNRVRRQIQLLLEKWNPETGDAQVVQELERFGNLLSVAADLLAQTPAAKDGPSLHAAVAEHFDQRAVEPLATLLADNAQRDDKAEAIKQAIEWLDQLLTEADSIDLRAAVAPLAAVASWTGDAAIGIAAIGLSQKIAVAFPDCKPQVLRGLRQTVRNQQLEKVKSVAGAAIASLRGSTDPPEPHPKQKKAGSNHSKTSE